VTKRPSPLWYGLTMTKVSLPLHGRWATDNARGLDLAGRGLEHIPEPHRPDLEALDLDHRRSISTTTV